MTQTLLCTCCERRLPDEAFSLLKGKPRPSRRNRASHCLECRRELHRLLVRSCEHCGRPTDSRKARLCSECRLEHQSGVTSDLWLDNYGEKYWTRERIIAAIQKFARERGRPPSAREWGKGSLGQARGFAPSQRRWPSVGGVQFVFGSWNAAIEAAGFEPRLSGGARKDPRVCRHGHRRTPENTAPNGSCRPCNNEKARRCRARRKRDRSPITA